ncbi:hypothetical protein SCHPADRAFT_892905 [Schizopora paradoxa]|uniref:DUF7918 domain-containing protein n=1 Tax=Schizopora paradoxa TaxID=27342 RepID=A0A0H2RJP2_9AGAM|nr:hypothetical protein SCHPADRAFT_892905 [Schizopora paradoxa]
MPTYNEFGAWVKVGGPRRRMLEYDTRVEDVRSTICYIASETGEKFTVCWRVPDDTVSYLVNLFIDGEFIDDCLTFGNGKRSGNFKGVWTGTKKKNPFMFSDITYESIGKCFNLIHHCQFISSRLGLLAEEYRPKDEDVTHGGAIENRPDNTLGIIVVEMYEVQVIDGYKRRAIEKTDKAKFAEKPKQIPEAKLNILTHTVGIAEESFRDRRPEICSFQECEEPKPVYCFEFHYRSEQLLRAQGILPKAEDTRRSPRKRKPLHDLVSMPPTKRERTAESEAEVELALIPREEDFPVKAETVPNMLPEVDEVEMIHPASKMTEREISTRLENINNEQYAIEEHRRQLESERELLDA